MNVQKLFSIIIKTKREENEEGDNGNLQWGILTIRLTSSFSTFEFRQMFIVIVGDEAFWRHKNIMKPYDRVQAKEDIKKVFLVTDYLRRDECLNALGLLSQIFRVKFYIPIAINPEHL